MSCPSLLLPVLEGATAPLVRSARCCLRLNVSCCPRYSRQHQGSPSNSTHHFVHIDEVLGFHLRLEGVHSHFMPTCIPQDPQFPGSCESLSHMLASLYDKTQGNKRTMFLGRKKRGFVVFLCCSHPKLPCAPGEVGEK